MTFDGGRYQKALDDKAAQTSNPHGEADFVQSYLGRTVLDAGCGTGRVGIELAARGFEVVGTDASESMLDVALEKAPDVSWVVADLYAAWARR